ncbi:MAG: arabinosyltransferase domain-containing protein, partial [Desulfobacterium sp.]
AANPTSPFVRLPALICAVLTWMLISKSIIPRLGEGLYKRKITTWTAAGVFLIFHMAFNNGMRPEPFVAMMALLTWALLEKSIATTEKSIDACEAELSNFNEQMQSAAENQDGKRIESLSCSLARCQEKIDTLFDSLESDMDELDEKGQIFEEQLAEIDGR